MTVMAGATISPTLPQMNEAFQEVANANFLVKLILTIPALFIGIFSPFTGYLLDRWGRKPVFVIAVVLYGFAGSAGFILESLLAILGSRALLGIAVAGIMTACITLIADYFKGEQLSKFMGLQAAFMGAGGVIFLLAGGLLADIGWRFPFLIYFSAFVILPGVLFFIVEPEHSKTPKHRKNIKPDAVLPIQSLIVFYAIGYMTMVIFYILPMQLPFYLKSLGDISNTQIGIIMAFFSLCAALASSLFHRIRQRLSFIAIFITLFTLMGTGYLIIALATSSIHVFIGCLIAGSGLGLLMPNLNVRLVTIVPLAFRGRAIGGMTTCVFLGQFCAPIFGQPIANNLGSAGVFGVCCGLLFILAGIFGATWVGKIFNK